MQFLLFAASGLLFYIGSMQNLTVDEIRRALSLDHERVTLSIDGYYHAAVLVPLIIERGTFQFLLTKRTDLVETHKGQVSFPGGMVDASDTDIIQTALREAQEEIGLPSAAVEPLGLLDDMATPTGFIITPVVGIIHSLPPLIPNSDEVAEVFCVPLEFFAAPDAGRSERREVGGTCYDIWFYDFGERLIWGATAMITRSLLKKLGLI